MEPGSVCMCVSLTSPFIMTLFHLSYSLYLYLLPIPILLALIPCLIRGLTLNNTQCMALSLTTHLTSELAIISTVTYQLDLGQGRRGRIHSTLPLGLGVILIRCFLIYFCQIFMNAVINYFCNMYFRDRRFSFYMPKVLLFGR